jgi:hypothetical protein
VCGPGPLASQLGAIVGASPVISPLSPGRGSSPAGASKCAGLLGALASADWVTRRAAADALRTLVHKHAPTLDGEAPLSERAMRRAPPPLQPPPTCARVAAVGGSTARYSPRPTDSRPLATPARLVPRRHTHPCARARARTHTHRPHTHTVALFSVCSCLFMRGTVCFHPDGCSERVARRALDAARFDKVKPARDGVLDALQIFRELQAYDGPADDAGRWLVRTTPTPVPHTPCNAMRHSHGAPWWRADPPIPCTCVQTQSQCTACACVHTRSHHCRLIARVSAAGRCVWPAHAAQARTKARCLRRALVRTAFVRTPTPPASVAPRCA